MKIIFDNNGFANLVQQPEFSQTLSTLKELSTASRITVVGSCTLLRELSGLALSNIPKYEQTLSNYKELIKGQILMPANDIVAQEGKQLKPFFFEDSLLDQQSVENLLDNLHDPHLAHALFGEVGSLKQKYGTSTEEAVRKLYELPEFQGASKRDVAKGYSNWFQDLPKNKQNWFVDLFDIKVPYEVSNLPHVSTYLDYALTRTYERFTFGKKNVGNDLLDREHFTDAAVVDSLITNDGAFIQTALRAPNRRFDVMTLKDFSVLVDQLAAD